MEEKYIPVTSITSGIGQAVLPDLYCYTVQIVNVIFVGNPGDPNDWVLVDAGMPKSADKIVEAAEERFGEGCRPKGIVLTHGHFDHVGAVMELSERWNVPVYAHELELPYLTGKQDYPKPDSTVDGGLVPEMSFMFPYKAIDLGDKVQMLQSDGSIPCLPGWKWIHVPGHSPGQVALFRERDRALIAADAFVTVKQESLYKVLTQKQEISGPPKYFTTDWGAAYQSVKRLEALKPLAAITGHGLPMVGQELQDNLEMLIRDFNEIAVPDHGRFVDGK